MSSEAITLDNIRELNVKEMQKILEITPVEQAIMLVGVHGIGKSQFIESYYLKHGYKVITVFLGQLADSSDLIGLPDRSEDVFSYDGTSYKKKVTVMCPPEWYPKSDEDKIVIFLDEFNRAKPEIYQVVMDMVLNRKLYQMKLPKNTRIMAAINPLDDKYGYQVTELDPALLDRFNVYGFMPSRKEWIYWAVDNKINKFTISFIAKHGAVYLDPPTNGKMGVKYPSRRSWHRLSNIFNNHSDIFHEEDLSTLKNVSSGIVGDAATSMFAQFIKEQKSGLNPGTILTNWTKKTEEIVKKASNQDLLMTNLELVMHIEENEDQYFGEQTGLKQREKYGYNLWQYLSNVPREIMASFYDDLSDAKVSRKKNWPDKVLSCNVQGLVDGFIDVVQGKTKKNQPKFDEPNIEDN